MGKKEEKRGKKGKEKRKWKERDTLMCVSC